MRSTHLTTNSKHGHQEKQLFPSFIFVNKTHEEQDPFHAICHLGYRTVNDNILSIIFKFIKQQLRLRITIVCSK